MHGAEPTYEYRVTFRKAGAPNPLARIVQTSSGVAALLDRRATVKQIERRQVGPWKTMGGDQ